MGTSSDFGIHLRVHDRRTPIPYVAGNEIEEYDMAQMTATPTNQHELRNVKTLIGLAVGSALMAALAGFVLLIVAPEEGSSIEGALGIAAAVGGIATAGFAIAAAIYAQIKNLWQYAPVRVRVLAWVLIAYATITTIWNWIT
jgi:hypothetical protein